MQVNNKKKEVPRPKIKISKLIKKNLVVIKNGVHISHEESNLDKETTLQLKYLKKIMQKKEKFIGRYEYLL